MLSEGSHTDSDAESASIAQLPSVSTQSQQPCLGTANGKNARALGRAKGAGVK
jgi:hypothetical protein